MKRIVVAILFGLLAGCICAGGGIAAGIFKLTAINVIWVLLNRGVMGFAIGISGLKLHWAWNGVIVGLAVGAIFSYWMFMATGLRLLPVVNFFVNGFFGLLIEFFTSKVFKLPSAASKTQPTPQTAVHAM
jgi:hypothetical protein